MAKPAQKIHRRLHLNLLYPQGVPEKLPEKFLKWALSYGRYIVVVVEVIVMAVFGARFYFDAQIISMKEKINNQSLYIESLADTESKIKETQLKLATIKNIYAGSAIIDQTLVKISQQIPNSVRINTLSIAPNEETQILQFRLVAESNSNNDLSTFLKGLKNEQTFANVNLASINFEQGQLVFSITGDIKK